MTRDDTPRDPVTGRAILGGRARRAENRRHLIAVQGSTVVHLLDLRDHYPSVLCNVMPGSAAAPATSRGALCGNCRRIARDRGWL